MNFPCEFVLKVFGTPEAQLEVVLLPVLSKYIKTIGPENITTKMSQGSKYIAISITFIAYSQEQLDNIYKEISARPDVLMVL